MLNDKKILVTGAAGFIGYHLCKSLLIDNYTILGVDNLNSYYDVQLKKNRLLDLNKSELFTFHEVDISNREKISESFKSFKPNIVVNLAAQAGVRYSIENPYAYLDSNLIGFLNIIELCRHDKIDGLIYASSSSVYGGNKKIPFSTEDKTDDSLSLYGATKKSNELIANSYSHLYGLHTTGLRFFTVYGPWGRPDMAMYIFANKIILNEPLPVFNNGDMQRDFTFVSDIVSGIRAAIDNNYKKEIFNLGNSKSENLMDMIALLEKYLNKKAIINLLPMQKGDVKQTFADIGYSSKKLGYMPKTKLKDGVKSFIEWYKKYHS